MVWIIITGSIAILIFLITVFRRDSNRRRIQHDIDRTGKIRVSFDRLRESNQRTAEHLETLRKDNKDAQRRTDNISRNNQTAKTGIRSTIDILKNAKKRSNNQGS